MTIFFAQLDETQNQEPDVIPGWVVDLQSFRRWAASDEFPESGRYSHLDGNLWIDATMERLAHNRLKTQIAVILSPLVEESDIGIFIGDRMLLTNLEAAISTEPDGMFISHDALAAGKVSLEKGPDSTEALGTPDMVLEVVSRNSGRKDKVVLRKLYHKARIAEYWIVDPLSDPVTLDLLIRHPRGYTSAPRTNGWVHSRVFGRKFRLTTTTNRSNLPVYHLEVQD